MQLCFNMAQYGYFEKRIMHSDITSMLCLLYDIKYALQILEEEIKREVGYYESKTSESEDTNV